MAVTTSTSSTTSPSASPSPIFSRLIARPVHLQQQSPLYALPQEIRDQIFAYACTPYTPAAPPPPRVNPLYPSTSSYRPAKRNPWNPRRAPYDVNTTYSRPGQRAKVHHPTALLSVCARTYLETAHLPVTLAAHNFYAPAETGPGDVLAPDAYFARMTPEQRALVRQVRVFGGVEWMLNGGLEELARNAAVRNVELLNVVVRWCDWQGWQKNEPLRLAVPSVDDGEEHHAAEEALLDEDVEMPELTLIHSNASFQDPAEEELEFATHADADAVVETDATASPTYETVQQALTAALGQLPALKAVRISIEAPYVKAAELEAQVAALLSWELPLAAKKGAEPARAHVQRSFEWEAPLCAWSDFCAHCGGTSGGGSAEEEDKACDERKRRRKRGLGPRVQGCVVRWM